MLCSHYGNKLHMTISALKRQEKRTGIGYRPILDVLNIKQSYVITLSNFLF